MPVVDFKAQAIYTNNPYAGSFRGYGNVQTTYATAQQMDMLADMVDIDPLEFHLKNAQKSGEYTPQKSFLRECALAECLETAAKASMTTDESGRLRGERQARPLKKHRLSFQQKSRGARAQSDGIGTILKGTIARGPSDPAHRDAGH